MDELKNILQELDFFLKGNSCPVIKHFQEGKAASEIVDSFNNMKFPIRNDIIQMYEWKNGVEDLFKKKTGEIELFTSGIIMPLELAVSMYALEARVQKSFKKGFFPLFTSGGGDYILMHLDEKKKTYGQLFLYSPSILLSSKPVSIYDSLNSLFHTTLEVYKKRGYYFNEVDKTLEVVYEIEKEIAIKMNPKSEFWRDN